MTLLLALALGCTPDQKPLADDEAPNLVVYLLRGEAPAAPADVRVLAPLWAPVEAPDRALPAALTSQWMPRTSANTLPQVLGLYGYATAAGPDIADPRVHGFAEGADAAWLDGAKEPFLYVDVAEGADALALLDDARERLTARGLRDRTAVVLAWTDGWAAPAQAWWAGLGAPPTIAGQMIASTLDITPTLLARARAAVPSDAGGIDLGAAAGAPTAYGEAADGSFVARTVRYQLRVPGAEPLPEEPPADATLLTAEGAPASDPAARAELYAALRSWRIRVTATTARERVGDETFQRLNAQQGYWQ